MKKVFFILAFLCSLSAQATPAIGDSVTFDITSSSGTGTFQIMLVAFDPKALTYSQQITTVINGKTSTLLQKVKAQDLMSDEKIDQTLSNCVAEGGQSQTITVPAGSFPTCMFSKTTGQAQVVYWVGKVPMGLVQHQRFNKGVLQQELKLKSATPGQ